MEEVEKKTLKEWRKEAGLTQAELAELAGLKQATVSGLERGEWTLDSPSARRLLATLNIDAELVKMPVVQFSVPVYADYSLDGYSADAPRRSLKWWRETRGLSMPDLALIAGLSRDHVRKIEQDRIGTLNDRTISRLVKALRVSRSALLVAGNNLKPTEDIAVENLIRAELRGARRALKRCYDFLSQDPNITFRAQDARDDLLRDIAPELKGL